MVPSFLQQNLSSHLCANVEAGTGEHINKYQRRSVLQILSWGTYRIHTFKDHNWYWEIEALSRSSGLPRTQPIQCLPHTPFSILLLLLSLFILQIRPFAKLPLCHTPTLSPISSQLASWAATRQSTCCNLEVTYKNLCSWLTIYQHTPPYFLPTHIYYQS